MKRIFLGLLLVAAATTSAFGFQSQFFLDEKGGVFRLDFSTDEFQGVTADSLIIKPDNPQVFSLYKIDTTQLMSTESQVPENQWLYIRANKDIQKFNRWEGSLDQELNKLVQRRKTLETILEQEKRGEFSLDPIERSNVENRITTLAAEEKPIETRIEGLRTEREELEKKLVARFSDARRQQFTEKPDFSVLGRWLPGIGGTRLAFHNARDGKAVMEINLTFPDVAGGNAVLLQQWLKAQGIALQQFAANTPGDSVFAYIQMQSAQRLFAEGKLNDSRQEAAVDRWNREASPDLYSILTGALAIQETLQLDRMTGSTDQVIPSIPIKRLSGPHIKSHPFAEMIGAKLPKTLPIDELIPADFYSCHFSDINRQIALSDLLEQWGTSLFQTMRVSAHDAQAKEKYLRQLCLEMTTLTRLFADKAIADLTICGADPFLHEGTDVSIVFTVKNQTLFDVNTARVAAQIKAGAPECREETFVRDGVAIKALTTPDRDIRSFSCSLGTFSVFSNSRQALETIIDTFHQKHPSIGQAMDYRYMRTIFPADSADEDSFVYLSDSHIRRLVGPVWKIARQRRLQCVNSLRILQNAQALFGVEHATGTLTLERLIKEGFVDPAYLFCPDGGTYSLQGSTSEPQCSHHGRLRRLTPILDEQPTLVTDTEWEQYQAFVKDYNGYWSRFFDPIGIRGQTPAGETAEGKSRDIVLETCILPLLENTFYNGFKRFSAGVPVRMDLPTHPRTILQLLCKLNLQDLRSWDASFEKFFFTLTEKTSVTGNELVDALGEALSINIVDDDLKFLINVENAGPVLGFISLFREPAALLLGNLLLTGLNVPTYAALSVRDDKKVERFIHDWLRVQAQDNALARRNTGSQSPVKIFTYETVPASGTPIIHTLDLQFYVINLHFFLAVHNGSLIIANQREIITEILANPQIRTRAETNLSLRVLLENFHRVTPIAHLLWQERMRAVCRNNLGSLFALSRFRGILPAAWWSRSLDINGYGLFCPAAGTYGYDAGRESISCSVHGDILSPKQPFDLDPNVPLNAFVSSLTGIEASLAFTPEGIMTKVRLSR